MEAIFARRSIGRLVEPAPGPEELRLMLRAAAAAPDHETLRPWRFVVLEGEARDAFGEVLLESFLARSRAAGREPTIGQQQKERRKLGRAPMVVVAGAVHQPDPVVPWEEQRFAVAAAVQNLLLAATSLGYGSMWRTGDAAYDERVKAAVGLRPEDAIVGFIYLGTRPEGIDEPPNQPDLDGVVRHWPAAAADPPRS